MNDYNTHTSLLNTITIKRSFSIAFILVLLLSGCAVKEGKVYEKDGKVYGKTRGVFKEKWKDFYIRGLSYSEGGYWEDAVADFTEAIKQRNKDQRRARAYGLHFVDYFPNRELGIAYFNLGRYTDAIKALEASLDSFPTARAKFYLNKSRQQWLNNAQLDHAAPVVSIEFPPPRYLTNDFSIRIKGAATDDFFIAGLVFNDKEAPLELSQQRISFDEEVPLNHGDNRITVQARDLLDSFSSPVMLVVKVDREGPLVFLEGKQENDGSVSVNGAFHDDSGLSIISLNGKEIRCNKTRFQKITEYLPITGLTPVKTITCVAEDLAGNKTTASVTITSGAALSPLPSTRLVACGGVDYTWLQFLPQHESYRLSRQYAVAGHHPSSAHQAHIDLKGLRDGQIVFLDTLYIEGTAFSPEGIKDITLNSESFWAGEKDESFAAFLKELMSNKKSSLSFSKLMKLREGPNRFLITLVDGAGNSINKTITIVRKIPAARQVGSRLTVSIYPFKETQTADASIADYVRASLSTIFVNQKRFNILERRELNRILEEQELSQQEIFNQETAVKLGRLIASEAILMGDIIAAQESVEIIARMVDTETSLILAEKDVYWEGKSRAGLKRILEGLAAKFAMAFPLCEGMVINKKAQEVLINIGSDHAISTGMRFLAFDETDPVIDPETGKSLGTDTEILGLISIKEIHEKFSKADIVKKLSQKAIERKNKVIAK